MAGHDFATFQKAYEKALVVSAAIQDGDKKKKKTPTPPITSSSFIQKPAQVRATFNRPNLGGRNFGNFQPGDNNRAFRPNAAFIPRNNNGSCFRCNKPQHPTTTCDDKPITCFTCQEVGHRSTVCPKKEKTSTPGAGGGGNGNSSATRINGKLYIMREVEDDGGDYAHIITGNFRTFLLVFTNFGDEIFLRGVECNNP